MKGTKQVATRMVNSENDFIDNIMNIASCSKQEAEKVLNVYRKFKVIKSDAVMGKISVKHGAYLDLDVIKSAIAMEI